MPKATSKAKTAKPKTATSKTAKPKKQNYQHEPLPAKGEVVAHQNLTLVEVADPAELSSFLVDKRLKDYILTTLSPTEAVILPEHSKAFIAALQKAGHTPKVSEL